MENGKRTIKAEASGAGMGNMLFSATCSFSLPWVQCAITAGIDTIPITGADNHISVQQPMVQLNMEHKEHIQNSLPGSEILPLPKWEGLKGQHLL